MKARRGPRPIGKFDPAIREANHEALKKALVRNLNANVLKARRNTLSAGFNPLDMQSVFIIGGAYFEAGIHNFAKWAKAVVADVGAEFEKYLPHVYAMIRETDGLDKEGMSSQEEIDEYLTNNQEESTVKEGGDKEGKLQTDNALLPGCPSLQTGEYMKALADPKHPRPRTRKEKAELKANFAKIANSLVSNLNANVLKDAAERSSNPPEDINKSGGKNDKRPPE
jgi:hypothetical protein